MVKSSSEIMKPIGGYFEIESEGSGLYPHQKGVQLNTGRNALEYIFSNLKLLINMIKSI